MIGNMSCRTTGEEIFRVTRRFLFLTANPRNHFNSPYTVMLFCCLNKTLTDSVARHLIALKEAGHLDGAHLSCAPLKTSRGLWVQHL